MAKLQKGSGTQNLIEIRDQVYSIIDLRKELFRKPVEGRNSQVTALLVRKSRQAIALLVDGSVCLILNISHFTPAMADKNSTQAAV